MLTPMRSSIFFSIIGVFVVLADQILDFQRATDRVDCARELHQGAVAHELKGSSGMLGDGRIDQIAPEGVEARQRSRFVCPHELRVAHNVHGEDRRQSSLKARLRYLAPPRQL